MKANVYNQQGEKTESVELSEELFAVKWNADLVHQVVVAMRANARQPVAHAKGRSEVSGTGRKPWRQKGSGRARHGSRRSPIWVGGGVTHGPNKEKNYRQKINKKMRARALAAVLSRKWADGQIILVDSLEFSEPKTKQAKSLLEHLGRHKQYADLPERKKNAACVAFMETEADRLQTKKSFRNLGQIALTPAESLNPLQILSYKYLIIEKPQEVLERLQSRLTESKTSESDAVAK